MFLIHEESCSTLSSPERWFRERNDKAMRHEVFHSVPDVIGAIENHLAAHNDEPKPVIRSATADSILEKVARGRGAPQSVNPH